MLIKSRVKQNQGIYDENKNSDEEEKEGQKEREIQSLRDQVIELSDKLERKQKDSDKQDKYADLLNDLYHKGIIDVQEIFLNE